MRARAHSPCHFSATPLSYEVIQRAPDEVYQLSYGLQARKCYILWPRAKNKLCFGRRECGVEWQPLGSLAEQPGRRRGQPRGEFWRVLLELKAPPTRPVAEPLARAASTTRRPAALLPRVRRSPRRRCRWPSWL